MKTPMTGDRTALTNDLKIIPKGHVPSFSSQVTEDFGLDHTQEHPLAQSHGLYLVHQGIGRGKIAASTQ